MSESESPRPDGPFLIEGPAVISFSGGRTSAYMLRRILDAGLQPDVHVIFTNTGKERPETLDFIDEVSRRWGVPVTWLEWREQAPGFAIVTHATAARQGEPFEQLITLKSLRRQAHGKPGGLLPNPVMRYCTQDLKIETKRRFVRDVLGWDAWTNAIGIRYDEPRRWRVLGQDTRNPREWKVGPLVEARVSEREVMAFWREQSFDLGLRQDEGNCDLCFLKHPRKRERLLRERPDLGAWWIAQEERTGTVFRNDTPRYADLTRQGDFFESGGEHDIVECECTD